MRKTSAMPELMPEKRMDSRGYLVTRHVRQEGSSAKKSGFPSIKNLFSADERLPGEFKKMIKDCTAHLDRRDRKNLMSTLHEDTLPALYALGFGNVDDQTVNDDGIRRVVDQCVGEGNFALLNNIVVFANIGEQPYPKHLIEQLIPPVKGLRNYQPSGSPRMDYSSATDEELEVAAALVKAVGMLSNSQNGCLKENYNHAIGRGVGSYFENPYFIGLLMTEPERLPSIVDAINTHKLPFRTDEDIKNLEEMSHMYDETMDVLQDGLL